VSEFSADLVQAPASEYSALAATLDPAGDMFGVAVDGSEDTCVLCGFEFLPDESRAPMPSQRDAHWGCAVDDAFDDYDAEEYEQAAS
jgi:hypothetical protein